MSRSIILDTIYRLAGDSDELRNAVDGKRIRESTNGGKEMSGNGFNRREKIETGEYLLEVVSASNADQFGPQIKYTFGVVAGEGEASGYTFNDYANRDENTGEVNQGSKAWQIFESAMGNEFDRNVKSLDDALEQLVGCVFYGKVIQTSTGSRCKVEYGSTRSADS